MTSCPTCGEQIQRDEPIEMVFAGGDHPGQVSYLPGRRHCPTGCPPSPPPETPRHAR
ncbi:hypothetical protein [Pseudonocardia alni]|uniref:hypothetical protein n=1 Tax=Pseudonocardia alni TaxID=33907 RepID=UPI0027A7BF39|nr:hypothetical protein PaSha_28750 [Pseudonocardia alni]